MLYLGFCFFFFVNIVYIQCPNVFQNTFLNFVLFLIKIKMPLTEYLEEKTWMKNLNLNSSCFLPNFLLLQLNRNCLFNMQAIVANIVIFCNISIVYTCIRISTDHSEMYRHCKKQLKRMNSSGLRTLM